MDQQTFTPLDVEQTGKGMLAIDKQLSNIFPKTNNEFIQYCERQARNEIRRSILYWLNEAKRLENDSNSKS